MSDLLKACDFSAFFRDMHGHEPFPWQVRLTEQVLRCGEWPKVIDLPTGAGKTAVLDTAVFALASRPDISPRRVVFVIDRRIVVDQVYDRAERIRDRIRDAKTDVLRLVEESLRKLSDAEEPLGVSALRGGVPIDREWAQRPEQPWVVVSTVDQFGSRLLFRGYGVTRGMRPVHAGLTGNDCLVFLDEVHLSVPFAETLGQVAKLKSDGLPRRFKVVEMSATPSKKDVTPFDLDSADMVCEELRRRVQAEKQAVLVSVRNHDAIPGQVSKILKAISGAMEGKRPRKGDEALDETYRGRDSVSVGVVVNRVRVAREVHSALKTEGYAAHLITGRMRPLDRIDALEEIKPVVDPDGGDRPAGVTIVVATQAIEVGADFSFDVLITECAAVDSLRQRFGRLDRRGTHHDRTGGPARAWIVGPNSVVASKSRPDPIYGESVKATWEELERRAKNGPIDVGPQSLRDFSKDAAGHPKRAPLLLNTYVDAWVQTNPEPIVQPDVEWFLHGIDQGGVPDVSIVWRHDMSAEALKLVPPRQAELLAVPIDAARAWLSGDVEADVADVGHTALKHDEQASSERGFDWMCWEGHDEGTHRIGPSDIRPGDVLVVRPERGGLRAGTWAPSSEEPVTDLGDAAQKAHGRRVTLRLDGRLPYIDAPPKPSDVENIDESPSERIRQWLSEIPVQGQDWLRMAVGRLETNGFEHRLVGVGDDESGVGYYVLVERDGKTEKSVIDPETMDGSDETGSYIGTGVTLDSHLHNVGERASAIAARLGLSAELADDLRLAGRLHDVGKVDERFQLMLAGGDRVELEMLTEPLAKSLPNVPWGRGGYPKGMRHELASVALAQSNPDVLADAHDSDLVLHLIGTHHGWARPLPPIIEDPEPQTLSHALDVHRMEVSSDLVEGDLALEMADRFWRLVERYGHHGLAWLEAILRMADHQQSAEEGGQL